MVRVKLFGSLRLDSGVKEFSAEASSVRELYPLLLEEIRAKNPDCSVTERDLKASLIAVNGQLVSPRARLRDGDTVYFFPSAAGG